MSTQLAGKVQTGSDTASDSRSYVSSRVLELWRRVDWRFLLPDPNLENVGYFGSSVQLLEALRTFSDSVIVFSDEQLGPVYPRFDLVVLSSPLYRTAELAARMVKPGGSIYMELGRLAESTQRGAFPRNLSGAMRYARLLWKAGFSEVHCYWHRPGFEDCRQIIPLFDRLAMEFALSRGGNFIRQAKLIASRGLLRAGLLHYVIPCYSVVGYRRSEDQG